MSKRKRPTQMEIVYSKRGGKRRGAGRPPRGEQAGVAHKARPRFDRRSPLHVTLRMAPRVWNLRSRRSLGVLRRALFAAADRFGARIVQFAILGNHVHLLIEADNTAALVRGVRGLSIRVAKRMNRLMSTNGQVIGDRSRSVTPPVARERVPMRFTRPSGRAPS